jgi:hypothetical protein
MAGDTDKLRALWLQAEQLDSAIEEYLIEFPSPRLNTHRPVQLIAAIKREVEAIEIDRRRDLERQEWRERHEAELAARRAERQAAREEARVAHAEASKYDSFTLQMAAKLKMTPDEFLALQEQRRREMAQPPPEPELVGSVRPDGTIVGDEP